MNFECISFEEVYKIVIVQGIINIFMYKKIIAEKFEVSRDINPLPKIFGYSNIDILSINRHI